MLILTPLKETNYISLGLFTYSAFRTKNYIKNDEAEKVL